MGKGVTEMCRSQRKHAPDNVGSEKSMQTSLRGIADKARENKEHRFQNLFGMLNEENLMETYGRLNKSSAPGVDRVTIREYGENLEENVSDLADRVKGGRYRAKLIMRKNIPKGNGKLRPLGIPATEDKLLQTAASDILMAIFEQDFLSGSFGYRPKVGALDAAGKLSEELYHGGYNFVVEADIKGFFNNIDHDWMLEMLRQRVDDESFLRLIRKWLKAGVLEEDKRIMKPESGTPQGGSISPVLANVYLHYAFDLWFQRVVAKHMRGKVFFVRYADDFVCLFQFKEDADEFYSYLPQRLAKFGLELSMEKTGIIPFNRYHKGSSFNFLGFEFRWRFSRKGRPYVYPRTSLKKMRSSLQALRQWCRKNRHLGTREIFKMINAKLRGHYNYFGFSCNYDRLYKFFYRVVMVLKKWLNRRSQKRNCPWEKFRRMLKNIDIERPRIRKALPPAHEQLKLISC